jgi:hypothetical protein
MPRVALDIGAPEFRSRIRIELVKPVTSIVRIGREWAADVLIAVQCGITFRPQLMLGKIGRSQWRPICVDGWVRKTYLSRGNKN